MTTDNADGFGVMTTVDQIPRGVIVGAGLLIGVVTASVGLHQLAKFSGNAPIADAKPAVVAERSMRFVDEGGGINAFGGGVGVYDATTGRKIVELKETDGFVRAVLNSMAFDQTKHGVTGDTVLTLSLRANHHLELEDPATGAVVNVGAFGSANRAVFERFLTSGDAS